MDLADDLLNGAKEIAAFMGLPARSIYHAIEAGTLPCFRIGAKICARKSTLLTWVAAQEAANDNRPAARVAA
ncbi:DNA-binding protein [Pelagibacterium sp. 26DY04]|uniref:helix-turn-helix transcriptional regulator n=1 Tax=Pelagibacterium sp. 26DY04 TaxID=2967130 RepID=UPI002815E68F|nr:DNA-binding protein [Pelagibacterium sp. 26DY04]WMT88667.1 DNA-binding protein [Pelagibacterium sp. 26DY04]